MIKVLCLVSLWCDSGAFAGHIGRVMSVSRVRMPAAFRPGVSLPRHWGPPPPRLMQAASHRAPYVLYKSPSGHRYMRPYFSGTRGGYGAYGGHAGNVGGPWRTTAKVPATSPVTTEYEFVRAASATPPIVLHTNGGTGAIHTIPAPNLSLSEKPIVVMDAGDDIIASYSRIKSQTVKPTYQVTEKVPDIHKLQVGKNVIDASNLMGLTKATSFTSPELNALLKNGAALQFAAEYGSPAIAVPQPQPSPYIPQQFTVQGFNTILQDPLHTAADSSLLSQNIMFQPDHMFMQKLQNQLYQRYPGIEFLPYQSEPAPQPQLYVINQEDSKPSTTTEHKTVVRATQEDALVTLVPQVLVVSNVTEAPVETTPVATTEPENVTLELVTTETQPPSTTVKYIIETTTENEKTTPIYYAQVGQSVGNVVANGFYSAINDVRAAAALAQVEQAKPQEDNTTTTTTTVNPDINTYFIQSQPDVPNQTVTELKPLHGVPFSKAEPVNIAYTLVRTDDSNSKAKVNKDGAVYAGQIVEASISEDQDFNKEKASLHIRHPPLRLFTVSENKETTSVAPKLTVVKAKIPPKSKLTFDDRTGEPVLRIYASYVDRPLEKDVIAAKLANIKHVKEIVTRKQDGVDIWKTGTVKSLDKPQSGSDINQVTEFGLKLRPRMDEYPALFEDYDD